MDGNIIGLVAVTMALGIPIAAMYTFYRVRKLRTDERIAAMARGVAVPMEPELSQVARSRRSGILLTAGAIGYIVTFALIGRFEHDAWIACLLRRHSVGLGRRLLPRRVPGAARSDDFLSLTSSSNLPNLGRGYPLPPQILRISNLRTISAQNPEPVGLTGQNPLFKELRRSLEAHDC